jgi:hypothetical protein
MEDYNKAKGIITSVVLVVITSLAVISFLSGSKIKTDESKEA